MAASCPSQGIKINVSYRETFALAPVCQLPFFVRNSSDYLLILPDQVWNFYTSDSREGNMYLRFRHFGRDQRNSISLVDWFKSYSIFLI